MTFTITTKYTSTANGQGRIVAKGRGRQRTIPYDHGSSAPRNHGTAAGVLARVLIAEATLGTWQEIENAFNRAALGAVHMGFNDGTHKFNITL
jgi:hypothetical protein